MNFVVIPPYRLIDTAPDFSDPDRLVEVVQLADRLGYHGMACSDHPLLPRSAEESGVHHDIDPFVAMATYAAHTTQIRLVSSLIIAPYHNAITTAKAISTIDVFSKGRVTVGLGAGYLTREFDALQVPFDQRNEIMDEGIRVMKALWTQTDPTFDGTYYKFSGVRQLPKPRQSPHPPIWIGGNSYRAIRRSVDLGQAWYPFIAPPEVAAALRSPPLDLSEMERRAGYARDYAEQVGRTEPLDIIAPQFFVSAGASRPDDAGAGLTARDEIIEHIGRLGEIGFSAYRLALTGTTVDAFEEQLEWFAAEIMSS
jgi:probable F420-dependent oxidoreductase